MGLRDIESALPPGFRFYPSDEELVCHYLYNKVVNVKNYEGTMLEVDLHTREPWELPEGSKLSESEWYFFSFRDRKYATGSRTNRATKSGYWKATGKDRTVYQPKTRIIVGMRKTLVFYSGRAPNGKKTSWVMHEFRLENPHTPPKEDWVLCRVVHKKKGDSTKEASFSLENEQDEYCIPPLVDQSNLTDGSSSEVVVGPRPHQQGASSSSSTLLNLASLQCNSWLGFPQLEEVGPTFMMGMGGMDIGMGMDMMGSKNIIGGSDDHHDHGDDDDSYGFLLDLGME